MSSIVKKLKEKNLISPPAWLPNQTIYEVYMGSIAYGIKSEDSDIDIYGAAIPPKDLLFPYAPATGNIYGFGTKPQTFDQYQQHHILNKEEGKEYDLSIYSLVRYMQLCLENNPNMIDSLFVPDFMVIHITKAGTMMREARKSFLHKGAWHKFKGYSFSQMHKMKSKDPSGKRLETRNKFGYDVKFATHCIRLLDEVEQILTLGDMELGRNREQLKAIRNGEVPEVDIYTWFSEKEKYLEKLYEESKLPYGPDETKIKTLLINCLEEHYGSLSDSVIIPDQLANALNEIQTILNKVIK